MRRFNNQTSFFGNVKSAAAAGAMGIWAATIVGMTAGCVTKIKKEEEARQKEYHDKGEIPPTRGVGSWFKHTPPREQEVNPQRFGPGL